MRRAFGGLEQHVTGETIRDGDIDNAAADFVAFDKADKASRQRRSAQQRRGFFNKIAAFLFFFADIDQANRRIIVGK